MITSTGNTRVKDARKLHRRRYRNSTGLLLVEGLRLLRDALEAGVTPHLVFYVPPLVDTTPPLARMLDTLRQMSVECLPVSPQVFETLTETVTPQGIAAILPRPKQLFPQRPSLVLILDRVRDPGNAGTLLRSALAAGADLALFAPNTVDPFNDKVVRAGMGAHFRLPIHACADWDQLAANLREDVTLWVADASARLNYDRVDWQLPSAVIVGGEADGPSEQARALARPVAIPMYGRADSLNAAMAGTIILFEAARQRRHAPHNIVYPMAG